MLPLIKIIINKNIISETHTSKSDFKSMQSTLYDQIKNGEDDELKLLIAGAINVSFISGTKMKTVFIVRLKTLLSTVS